MRQGRENKEDISMLVQTAVLREQDSNAYLNVFDILGEISALDHLGLVTDPLLCGFVQLLVLIQ